MTREEIVEGLKLLEDNMVHFDELQNDKGEWIDVHELLFEAIQALSQEPTEKPMCDRNICLSNEYNGIECDECIVNKAEQEPCEDVVSRKAVLDALLDYWHDIQFVDGSGYDVYEDCNAVINELPSVTQKSDNKYRKEAKRWKNKWLKSQKSAVLDKIRDEIVEEQSCWREDTDAEWHECRRILRIIDKYRGDKNEI